jgi:hypothetical protein
MTKRNITIKLLFISLIIATGCSKDLPQASLIGKWNLTQVVAGGCSDPADNGKGKCSSGCVMEITATKLTPSSILGQPVYDYTASAGLLKLTSVSTGTVQVTYELTPSTLILSYPTTDGCTNTLYFTKA